MPHVSLRKRTLVHLQTLIANREWERVQAFILDSSSSGSSSSDEVSSSDDDDDSLSSLLDAALQKAYNHLSQSRYVRRLTYRGSTFGVFARDLASSTETPWLTEEEFQEKYRLRRDSFSRLVALVRDHKIFTSPPNKRKQAPVEYQLMVLLHYLGTAGSGASNPRLRNQFGLGRGTTQLYRDQCVVAIRSLRDQVITWPDEEERERIAKRVQAQFDLPNCIAVADGTLIPLQFQPHCVDAPDYSGRKHQYSLSVMVVNDDQRRVRYYLGGFPGSAHDSRVYSATKLAQTPHNYFGTKYYLVGDSAFENSASVVSCFKAPRGHSLGIEEERFNTHIGRFRVTSEHTIGMLKARFPWMRCMPMVITDKKMHDKGTQILGLHCNPT